MTTMEPPTPMSDTGIPEKEKAMGNLLRTHTYYRKDEETTTFVTQHTDNPWKLAERPDYARYVKEAMKREMGQLLADKLPENQPMLIMSTGIVRTMEQLPGYPGPSCVLTLEVVVAPLHPY